MGSFEKAHIAAGMAEAARAADLPSAARDFITGPLAYACGSGCNGEKFGRGRFKPTAAGLGKTATEACATHTAPRVEMSLDAAS